MMVLNKFVLPLLPIEETSQNLLQIYLKTPLKPYYCNMEDFEPNTHPHETATRENIIFGNAWIRIRILLHNSHSRRKDLRFEKDHETDDDEDVPRRQIEKIN